MKKLALVPVLVFLIAALLLPAWRSGSARCFAFDTRNAAVPQHFERCTDFAPSQLIHGVCFTSTDGGQPLRVHSNGSLVVTTDPATGRPIAVTLSDGSEIREPIEVRPSTLVPGWLQVTARDGLLDTPTVVHTDGLVEITGSSVSAP